MAKPWIQAVEVAADSHHQAIEVEHERDEAGAAGRLPAPQLGAGVAVEREDLLVQPDEQQIGEIGLRTSSPMSGVTLSTISTARESAIGR